MPRSSSRVPQRDTLVQSLEMLAIADLHPHPRNDGQHPPDELAHLKQSLTEHGVYRNVVVAQDGTILAGHGVVEAARALGHTHIAAQRLPYGLDDPRALKVLVGDNHIARLRLQDDALLVTLLEELSRNDPLALLGTGFDAASVAALLDGGAGFRGDDAGRDVEPQVDRAEELREQWGVEVGQLWEIGIHRLLCGDCRRPEALDRLLDAQGMDTVLFDPPYDADPALLAIRWPCQNVLVFTDHRQNSDCIEGWRHPFRCLFVWDGVTSWYVPGWPLARGKFCLWFGASQYNPNGAHYGEPGVGHTVTNTRGTYAYHPDPRGKHLSTIFQAPNTQQSPGHAHSKPVDWVRMLLANCTQGVVFDGLRGSGTTLIACEHLGRPARLMEIDPAVTAVVLERAAGSGFAPKMIYSP